MRRPRPLVLAALLAGLAAAPAATAAPASIPLSHGWKLQVGRRASGAASPGPWAGVTVPGVMDPRPLAKLYDGTVGTYELSFQAPASGMWAFHFERVRRIAHVYLNGHLIGTHTDPYSPFDVKARGLILGRTNTLRVVVDNRRPRGRREPFWNWGGIDRPVWLEPRGPVHLERLFLNPVFTGGAWQIQVSATMVNDTAAPQSAAIDASATAPGGTRSTGTTTASVGPRGSVPVRFVVPVRGTPDLWSPDHPALYADEVTVTAGGQTVEDDTLHSGLRTIGVAGGRLYLNGAPLTLRGAGISEDTPSNGDALSDVDIDAYVQELKALGANVTRAHIPLDDRLLSKLDAAGILVWNEAPVIHADTKLQTAAGRAEELNVLRRTLLATRNHPSIVTDSVADELSSVVSSLPGSVAYLQAAVNIVHGLDPGRPVAMDVLAYPGYPPQPVYQLFDLLGINAYFGWYPGRKTQPLPGVDQLGAYLQQTHDLYPAQALVLSEFGAEAFAHGPVSQKGTYEFQTAYALQVLGTVAAEPFMQGAIYWTLRDFAVKPGWAGGPIAAPSPTNPIFHKGLIARGGTPKPAFYAVRDAFARWPGR